MLQICHDAQIMQLTSSPAAIRPRLHGKTRRAERASLLGDTVPSFGFVLTRIFATWRRRCSARWSSAVNMLLCTLDATEGARTKRSYLGTGRYLISQPKICPEVLHCRRWAKDKPPVGNLLVSTDRFVAQQVASSDAETTEALLLVRLCVTLIASWWPRVSRRYPRPRYVILDCACLSRASVSRHGL
jgi:hypothetical protein